MVRILFVCMGNICRSPAAEGVFRNLVEARGFRDAITIDSAGTIDFHAGEPSDERMRRAAQKRGLHLQSIARGIDRADFDRFDWIVTMDDENFRNVAAAAPDANARRKVRRFTDWVSLPDVREVPDPYYGGVSGFDHVLDLLEDGSGRLLDWIVTEHGLAEKLP